MRKLWYMFILFVIFNLPMHSITVFSATNEKAMFPMQYMNISQGVNESYSHQGRLAIDLCGRDRGIDAFYAPFTGTIKKIYGADNVVWLESNAPVEFADGTVDYMTIMCMHDNDISDLYVGKVIRQGEQFLSEGTAGSATGNHIHLECGRGRFSGSGWYENSYGKWCINNGINPWQALYISDSTIIYNDYGYGWKKASSDSTPPSNPKLMIYTNSVAAGEPILFEYSVENATNMYIAIDVNGVREHFIEVWGDHYNGTFTKPGRYEAYLYATNTYGNSGLSNCDIFYVYNTPPSNAKITLNKALYPAGTDITFQFDAENADEYQIAIYQGKIFEGTRVYASDKMRDNAFVFNTDSRGEYYAYVSAYNSFGYSDSWPVAFEVYNTSPHSCWITANRTKISKGESITFRCGAEIAEKYTIGINKEGVRIFTDDIRETFTKTFTDAGHYTAYVTASNYFGLQDSGKIEFTVYEDTEIILTSKVSGTEQYCIDTEILNLEQSAVYVAGIYDENESLLNMKKVELHAGDRNCSVLFKKYKNAAYIKTFLWDTLHNMQPLTETEIVHL